MRHVPSISQEAGEACTLRVAFASSAEGGIYILGSQVGGVYYDGCHAATSRVRPSVTSFLRGKIGGTVPTNRVRIMSPYERRTASPFDIQVAPAGWLARVGRRAGRLVGRRETKRDFQFVTSLPLSVWATTDEGSTRRDARH